MAYRLRTGDEPVSSQIRRIFLEEIDSAIKHLSGASAADRDGSIHEARKSIKKIRALLRLTADQLGQHVFRRENRRFRNLGRDVSELRDAQAVIESFSNLPGSDSLSAETKRSVETQLESEKARVYKSLDVDDVLRSVVHALHSARPHLKSLSIHKEGFSSIEPGLIETYRQGRKALKRARGDASAENLHDLRKRVKDYWYHTRLLSGNYGHSVKGRQDELRKLETLLGDGHNLHVLAQKLGTKAPMRDLVASLKAREAEMGKEALQLAEDIYALKRSDFKAGLADLHQVWTPKRKGSQKGALQHTDGSEELK